MEFIKQSYQTFPDKVLLMIFPKFYAFGGRIASKSQEKNHSYILCGLLYMELPEAME